MAMHLERGSVNIQARGRNLRDVLDELFLVMGAKYDLPPEVQGTVSIDLHNATYAQALDLLLGSEFTYSIGPHDIIYVHRGHAPGSPETGENTPRRSHLRRGVLAFYSMRRCFELVRFSL